MGLKADWMIAVEVSLKDQNIQVECLSHVRFHLLFIPHAGLLINLVPIRHHFVPQELITLQQTYQLSNIQVVHLWEDVFQTKKAQVISRIRSMLGYNKRIHGRKTKVEKISQSDAEHFLNVYHLQSSVGARYKFGLIYHNELIAVATFSNKRRMTRKSADYTSAELIRFATKDGYTVVGGLSKLIKHYGKVVAPNDIMSYADRDWSLGKGYIASGFKLHAETPPAQLLLNLHTLERCFTHRIPIVNEEMDYTPFAEIFNTGNLKYVLDL